MPIVFIAAMTAAWKLLTLGVLPVLVTPSVVGPLAGTVAVLERVRPERKEYVPLDKPILLEAAHFLLNFELGYGCALFACDGVAYLARSQWVLPTWPTHWPLPFQVFVALLIYEGTSYWQHRALHHYNRLWKVHALHHSGERLNFIRATRFHALDISTAAFVAYVPLVLLKVPDSFFAILGVLLSCLGIFQHTNLRIRTPWWLDRIVCTPAVHRHHHSRLRNENDTNFGNTLMLFDVLFRTYGIPRSDGPAQVGVENDQRPSGFWKQTLSPFYQDT